MFIFQIKEYRFDRFVSALHDWGIGRTLYFRSPRIPGKSTRNFLLALWVLMAAFFVIFLFKTITIVSAILLIFIIPILVFIWVGIGVLLTDILAQTKRKSIIRSAKQLFKDNPQISIIGITGCFGKTTTKEFLTRVLISQFSVAQTKKNWNTDVGIALSALSAIQPSTQYFIAEVGGYKKGEIKAISKWLKPKFGFFTGMGNQHLDLYGSPKALREGETELLFTLPTDGHAYISIDTQWAGYIISRCHCQVTTCSFTNTKADIFFTDYHVTNTIQHALAHYKNETYSVKSAIIGKHIFMNFLPVIAFCLDQGMTWEKIDAILQFITPLSGKLSLHQGIQKSIILNDAINSNVNGFLGLIETMSQMPQQHKYIISKGIIELGSEKKQSYQHIISTLTKYSIPLLTTDPLFQRMSNDSSLIHLCANENELMAQVKEIANDQTLIALEGKFSPSFIRFCIPE